MIINESSLKMWSRMGSRAAFGIAMVELGKEEEELIVLTADVSTSAGLERFAKTFPEKFINVGIAEQNMIGIATGLASEGKKVVTTTFAPFQTMRCCEQIRVNLGYMHQKVCMVGLASGIVLGTLGYTHCCFEDIAIMRAIPNITIISPADCGETVKAISAIMNYDEPVYLRLTGGANAPMVYKSDYDFEIGKAITLREGSDVTIIATGTMVYEALATAELLLQDGISVAVVNMHTIKPLDKSIIDKACNETNLIVTVEEHNVIGGLGSAIAEYKTSLRNTPPQVIMGIPDTYSKAGEYKYLLDKYKLTAAHIAERIKFELGAIS